MYLVICDLVIVIIIIIIIIIIISGLQHFTVITDHNPLLPILNSYVSPGRD